MNTSIYNVSGEVVGQAELDESIFGLSYNEAVVHQALVMQLANQRQGTAATKSRGEVHGSRRKLYAQKHTGRARRGDKKSPLLRGGGVAFGPQPRDYRKAMPKKMRQLALKCVLSSKMAEGNLKILEELSFDEPKTKNLLAVLKALNIDENVLIVTENVDTAIVKSASNINDTKVSSSNQLSILELLSHNTLLMTIQALRNIEKIWHARDDKNA